MKLLVVLTLLLATLALAISPAAATIYVKTNGNDGNSGASWDLAKKTIQAGLNATSSGEVWVAAGTYTELVSLKANVSLYGGFAGTETLRSERNPKTNLTVINGNGTSNVVMGANSATIDGFTIRNGAYGIYCTATSPTISNNVIAGNVTGGIQCTTSGSPTITNNVITGNGNYGVNVSNGNPRVFNNTIVASGTAVSCLQGSPIAANNILAFNTTGVSLGGGVLTLNNNDVYGNKTNYLGTVAGSGDISSDPQFASVDYGNFHIRSTSPCRNAGTPTAAGVAAPTIDMDAQARPEGAGYDIGADESYGESYPVPYTGRQVYVNGAVATSGDGTSWASPYKKIQDGIDDTIAKGGADILVAQGTYVEQIKLRPFAHLYGGYSGQEGAARSAKTYITTIDAGNTSASTVVGSNLASIDGFNIRGGNYGIYCLSVSPVISNNAIGLNSVYGIYCRDGGNATITGNNIIANTTQGINCNNSSPTITNNIVMGSTKGVEATNASAPAITNNTIVGNGTGLSVSSTAAASSLVASNNIIANNSTGVTLVSGTALSLKYNDVYGNNTDYLGSVAHTSDIAVDPQFASLAYGDFHIDQSSLCRNAGDPSAPALPSIDMDGQARPEGSAVDIGADESYGESYRPYNPRTIYVKGSAPGGNGTSWDQAYKTLAAAGDDILVKGGANVLVAQGTYAESLTMRPFGHLYGGYQGTGAVRDTGLYPSIIDPGSTIVPAVIGSTFAEIDGFTIKGGSYGIKCSYSSPVIANNTITGSATYGIYCDNSSAPAITGNTLYSNGTTAGMYFISSSPSVKGNTISDNTTGIVCAASSAAEVSGNKLLANTTGISSDSSAPVITNNVIAGSGSNAIYLYNSTAQVTNNTLVGNGTGLIATTSGNVKLYNNIIASNTTGINIPSGSAIPTISHNDVYGNGTNYSGTSQPAEDTSVDPQFASLEYGNFHIKATSLCRNAGDSAAPGVPSVDMDGQARPEGSAVDIGADESYGETYDALTPRIIYVNTAATGAADGTSWDNAYKTIQAAIDDTIRRGGGQIWVAQGSYGELIKMRPFAQLYGGFAKDDAMAQRNPLLKVTTITGTGTGTIVTGASAAAIDGFTITRGDTGVSCNSTSPTITNNIIKGNATYGIICSSSTAIIRGNTISANRYGINCTSSSPTITGNAISMNSTSGITTTSGSPTISSNTISGNSGPGIDCLTSGSPVITNNNIIVNTSGVTTTGNTTTSPSPIITNNTIACSSANGLYFATAANSKAYNNIIASNGTGIYVSGASPALSHNCVSGNTTNYSAGLAPGSYDVSQDPQFASLNYGNFHIRPTSPCRNAGNSAAPGVPSVDLDGQARPEGSSVDIGADESYGEDYPSPYPARVVYVDAAANGTADGTSWTNAYKTVQAGVDDTLTRGGAEIWVAQGTYVEQVKLRPFTHLYGGFASGDTKANRNPATKVTTIDAGTTSNNTYAVTALSFTTIDGFAVKRGLYGIYCLNAAPTINNDSITGNSAGIYCSGGLPTINCISVSGAGSSGIELRSGANATVTNCTITGRSTGVYINSAAPNVTNNTVVGNTTAVTCISATGANIYNNIIGYGSIGINVSGGTYTIRNNCVVNNASADYSPSTVSHPADIYADPMLADRAAGNFHLLDGSPCIDGGNDEAPGLPAFDFEGQARKQGLRVDIGADETAGASVEYISLVDAKKLGNDAPAAINTGIVTYATADMLYVETIDRTIGIQVRKTAHGLGVGMRADVQGAMKTDTASNERYILATNVTRVGTDLVTVKPIGMPNKALGGVDWNYNQTTGAGQKGVDNGYGLNNIGLLVRTWGKVTADTSTTFFVNDGSGLTVKVILPAGIALPESDSYVGVTGISSCADGGLTRVILVRDASDVVVLKPAITYTHASIAEAKKLPNDSAVWIDTGVVTYADTDMFYIESQDRFSGIQVHKLNHGLTSGMRVSVQGKIKTVNAERYIAADSATRIGTDLVTIKPLGMTNSTLGGASWFYDGPTGRGQVGVEGGTGLNNIGLLIRACGYLSQVGNTLRLDDGSGVPVILNLPTGAVVTTGSYVAITGVSSCMPDMTVPTHVVNLRLIWVARSEDIQTIIPAQ